MSLIAPRTTSTALFVLRLTFSRLAIRTLCSPTAPHTLPAASVFPPISAAPTSSRAFSISASAPAPLPPHSSVSASAPDDGLHASTPDSPLPPIQPVSIDRPTLDRLHRLSALNPPPPGSDEERRLTAELGELVGLMDLVKHWEVPPGEEVEVGQLLSEGVGEVVIDEEGLAGSEADTDDLEEGRSGEARGRELLQWGTNKIGDYYAHRREKPTG